MLFYLVTRAHAYTFDIYLQTWGRALKTRTRGIFYDQLPYYRRFENGTYIFSDLERLSPAQLELASLVYEKLLAAGTRVLNNPATVLRREPLLRKLHQEGLNPFAVYQVSENLSKVKFPVFLRNKSEHDGSLTDLLHEGQSLQAAIEKLKFQRINLDDVLVIEFVNVADQNKIYHKYSAFAVAGDILPRHLLHGTDWVLKTPDLITPHTVAQEMRYLEEHPHATQLARIFALANIDYGRIDYSMLDEKLVTWEINTNPVITVEPGKLAVSRLAGQAIYAEKLLQLLKPLSESLPQKSIPFRTPATLWHKLGIGISKRLCRKLGLLMLKMSRKTPWRQLLSAGS